MDKIEKIRVEIERELSTHDKVDHLEAFEVGKAWSRGHKKALENLKSFIDSLQQEQPEVDLEKEIQECWQNWLSPSNQNSVDGVLPKEEFAFYARHFYELGKNSK